MSSQVPREMPVGCAVRYADQIDGATWPANAAVSRVPRAIRPAPAPVAISAADHAVIATVARRVRWPRRSSSTASTPARSTAADAAASALQNPDSTK